MNRKFELKDFPEKWVPPEWKKKFDICLLSIDDHCEVLEGLLDMQKNCQDDFKSLLSTIRMQLESASLLKNKCRLNRKDDNNKVLEFKALKGHSRLFGFIDRNDSRLIICTNHFWKTAGKRRRKDHRQNEAFCRAERLMNDYYSQSRG